MIKFCEEKQKQIYLAYISYNQNIVCYRRTRRTGDFPINIPRSHRTQEYSSYHVIDIHESTSTCRRNIAGGFKGGPVDCIPPCLDLLSLYPFWPRPSGARRINCVAISIFQGETAASTCNYTSSPPHSTPTSCYTFALSYFPSLCKRHGSLVQTSETMLVAQ